MSKLNVKILSHTMNPEEVVTAAGKLCYSQVGVEELLKKQTPESINRFVNMLLSLGHESPLEHVSFNFAIEGISRACSHQLVRHRIASPSQQSQRYVNLADTFEYITPNIIEVMDEYYEADYTEDFAEDMREIHDMYTKWQKRIEKFVTEANYPTYGMTPEKVANENARAVLPNACETKLVFTMNLRSLINFTKHRCCRRAQSEINELAWAMIEEVKQVSPLIGSMLGAPCQFGACPEGKMTCKYPYPKK